MCGRTLPEKLDGDSFGLVSACVHMFGIRQQRTPGTNQRVRSHPMTRKHHCPLSRNNCAAVDAAPLFIADQRLENPRYRAVHPVKCQWSQEGLGFFRHVLHEFRDAECALFDRSRSIWRLRPRRSGTTCMTELSKSRIEPPTPFSCSMRSGPVPLCFGSERLPRGCLRVRYWAPGFTPPPAPALPVAA